MKKFKILAPLMATVAAVAPTMATLTSCGKTDYTEQISEIKDLAITNFIDLSSNTHRNKYDEGELFDYIVKQMASYGYTASGQDKWSDIPVVRERIASELAKYPNRPQPSDTKKFSDWGNIWFDIPATEGYESVPKIIIMAHMEASTAFANDEAKTNWEKATTDIIKVTYNRDDDLLETDKKVSMGADDGLGIATMLAIAKRAKTFKHGGIRLLFTAGETENPVPYKSGSDFLYNDQIHEGKAWIDRDAGTVTEESYLQQGSLKPFGETAGEFPYIISTEGVYKNTVYCSAAGIHECEIDDQAITLNEGGSRYGDYGNNKVDWSSETGQKLHIYSLSLKGLHGGSSSKYMNDGYASALQLLSNILFTNDYSCRLFTAESEDDSRTIPSTASATFATSISEETIRATIDSLVNSYKIIYPNDTWETFTYDLTPHDDSDKEKPEYWYSMSPIQTRAFTKLCGLELIYGPAEWFDADHKRLKTSCNFSSLKLTTGNGQGQTGTIHIHNVCRSADENSLNRFMVLSHSLIADAFSTFYMAEGVQDPWAEAEKHITHIDKPVWERTENNQVATTLYNGFKNLGITPTVLDTHGWIDVNVVPSIYDDLKWTRPDITCLGPEIKNSHLTTEQVWADTLGTCIGALLYVIDNIKAK